MTDMLKRSIAPVMEQAWRIIDETAVRTLKSMLSARALVDFSGPHGWEFAAVNLGRLEVSPQHGPQDVPWGLRSVLAMTEVRVPFVLSQMELDSVTRGCADPDLKTLEEAARRLAIFEENAVYNGFEGGRIQGMLPTSPHPPITLAGSPDRYPAAVADAIKTLSLAGIDGPYALVLGNDSFYPLMQAGCSGYPPQRIIRDMLQHDILWSPALRGGVLLSTRGGDFELTVGADMSIGYAGHTRDQVELYLTESFTFRVLEPAAAIELRVP